MHRFSDLFSKGSHPRSDIIYYVMSVIFIILAFTMGIIDNPPGIIMLLLGIYMFAFPFIRRRREIKKGEGQGKNKNKKK